MRGIDLFRNRAGSVREPAVAGLFYPDDPEILERQIDDLLGAVEVPEIPGKLIGIIAPHAGYTYSGQVAAHGYRLLQRLGPSRVVLLAPSHFESFNGVSIFGGAHYATPLGRVPVDRVFGERLSRSAGAEISDRGHRVGYGGRGEHSLEVQLPFLQRTLPGVSIIPVVMGSQNLETCRKLGVGLSEAMDDTTAIVASSDLSHYHPYSEAKLLDTMAGEAVRNWDYVSLLQNVEERRYEACGAGPIATALIAAQRLSADRLEILCRANSGDVPPFNRDGVVGYLSAGLIRSTQLAPARPVELNPEQQKYLLSVCREGVWSVVTGESSPLETPEPPGLNRLAAVFVTIRICGELRGCIGSIVARDSLHQAARSAAIAAATQDPRFTPVTAEELEKLDYSVSVLTPLRLIRRIDEIEIGRHGLVVEHGARRGLLLPQVALEHGWDRLELLGHTCVKAGLDRDAWQGTDTVIYTFTAQVVRHPPS